MLDFKPFQTVKISTVISYKYLKSLFFYSYFPIPPQQTHEAAHNGDFSYSRNFYAKDADKLYISLPVKNEQPDYELMSTLISAMQKLVIADVVKFSDEKIKATKQVVG